MFAHHPSSHSITSTRSCMLQIGLVSYKRQQHIQKQRGKNIREQTRQRKYCKWNNSRLNLFPHLCSSSFSLLHHAGACTGDSRNTATPRRGRCQMPVVTGRAALAFDLQEFVVKKSCIVDRFSDEKVWGHQHPKHKRQTSSAIIDDNYELKSYKRIGQSYEPSFRLTSSRWSVCHVWVKNLSNFPPTGRVEPYQMDGTGFFRGYSNGYTMWTPKTPNLMLAWCKKSKQSNRKLNASTLLGKKSSINISSNLFRNFCFTLTACAARKLYPTPISMDDTSQCHLMISVSCSSTLGSWLSLLRSFHLDPK